MKEASAEQRKATAAAIEYDLLVIGGGIVGTGIARDASMRGLSVVLFEKDDLSCGTSSKSSRLIHGGLRYLQTYDFGLVFKDLHEREVLLRIAPHLIKPLKFVIPNYDPGIIPKSRIWLGMVLYDLLSAGKSLPSHKMLSKQGLLELEPELNPEGLQGGAAFYDCQAAFAERIAVENAISANEHGARIFTHAPIKELVKTEGKVCGAIVEDQFSGQSFSFRSKVVVNAAGPWADEILELAQEGHKEVLRKTKGIHIVVPKITTNALAFYAKSDGRLIFAIPWLENTLVGTTDTDFNADAKNAVAENEEVTYLLKEVSNLIGSVKGKAIEFSYAGIRPLVRTSPKKSVSAISRNYKIVDQNSKSENGLISVLGVKLTSYRAAAQETVDLIAKKLGRSTKCSTEKENLPGGRGITHFSNFSAAYSSKLKSYQFDKKQISYFLDWYGMRVEKIFEIIDNKESLARRICSTNPQIFAEILLAVEAEYALTISDFMMRRVPLVFAPCQGLDCVEEAAIFMGNILAWSSDRVHDEISAYRGEVDSKFRKTFQFRAQLSDL